MFFSTFSISPNKNYPLDDFICSCSDNLYSLQARGSTLKEPKEVSQLYMDILTAACTSIF